MSQQQSRTYSPAFTVARFKKIVVLTLNAEMTVVLRDVFEKAEKKDPSLKDFRLMLGGAIVACKVEAGVPSFKAIHFMGTSFVTVNFEQLSVISEVLRDNEDEIEASGNKIPPYLFEFLTQIDKKLDEHPQRQLAEAV